MNDESHIERLIVIAERLIGALEADILALKMGTPTAMKTSDPEIQRLSAQYSREARGLDPAVAKTAPAPLRARLIEITRKFRDVLQRHTQAVVRVKNASEGMIRAIAEEVERLRAPTRTYGRTPAAHSNTGALIYNKVI
jgi:hypothetical protein